MTICATCRLSRLCTTDGADACEGKAYAGFATPHGTTLQAVSRERIKAWRGFNEEAADALWREYRRMLRPAPSPGAPGAALAFVWRPLPAQPDLFGVEA
jgi:hypothetical protein